MNQAKKEINETYVAYQNLSKKFIQVLDTTCIEKGTKSAEEFIDEANTLADSLKNAKQRTDNQSVKTIIQEHVDQIHLDIDYLKAALCGQV